MILRKSFKLDSDSNSVHHKKQRHLAQARGRLEVLEDRRMLAAFNLAEVFENPVSGSNVDNGYGDAIAIDNSTLIAGAPFDDTTNYNAGKVHVYSATTNAPVYTFTNPSSIFNDPSGDQFGHEVDINRFNIAVSAVRDRVISGSSHFPGAGTVWFQDLRDGVWSRFDHPDPSH